jgi:hypothetical protein
VRHIDVDGDDVMSSKEELSEELLTQLSLRESAWCLSSVLATDLSVQRSGN